MAAADTVLMMMSDSNSEHDDGESEGNDDEDDFDGVCCQFFTFAALAVYAVDCFFMYRTYKTVQHPHTSSGGEAAVTTTTTTTTYETRTQYWTQRAAGRSPACTERSLDLATDLTFKPGMFFGFCFWYF